MPQVGSPFQYSGRKPLDERQQCDSLELLISNPTNILYPPNFKVYCILEQKEYRNVAPLNATPVWEEYKGDGGINVATKNDLADLNVTQGTSVYVMGEDTVYIYSVEGWKPMVGKAYVSQDNEPANKNVLWHRTNEGVPIPGSEDAITLSNVYSAYLNCQKKVMALETIVQDLQRQLDYIKKYGSVTNPDDITTTEVEGALVMHDGTYLVTHDGKYLVI